MATELVPFVPSHLAGTLPLLAPSLDAIASTTQGPAYTLMRDGQPLGSAGIAIPWAGFGEAWAHVSPEAAAMPRLVHPLVKRGLAIVLRHCHLRVVHARVYYDFELGMRWAERLGFEPLVLMERYGPNGETVQLFERKC